MTLERALRPAIAALALVGAGVTAYLTATHYAHTAPLCVGCGCELVQRSDWATLAGVPVATLGLLAFLAIVLRKPKVWRYADPLGALNLAVMVDGDELLWHFDQTDFVVSLMLQRSLRGGDFEYVPYIRNAIEPNFLRVQRLLEGDRSDIITLDLAPGTLALFEGRYSIHRVGPVEGSKPRVIALLGYDTKPGTVSSDLLKQRRYGRVG